MLGLLAYAIGALAMTVAQGLTTIIIFWAIIGGLGASLLLPAMQSLIHGNFTGQAPESVPTLSSARPWLSQQPLDHFSVGSLRPTCRGGSASVSRW